MPTAQGLAFSLTDEEKTLLARIAAQSIERGLAGQPEQTPAPPAQPPLHAPCGAFVTLHAHGRLRGCIGTIMPHAPLYETVSRMASAAAFADPRFAPLQAEEWPEVDMEISVLSAPTRCPDPAQVEVGRHGLILVWRGKSGVFLPQVPVEQGWDRLTYLEHLCDKAGVPRGAWREADAELYWFEALVFPAHS